MNKTDTSLLVVFPVPDVVNQEPPSLFNGDPCPKCQTRVCRRAGSIVWCSNCLSVYPLKPPFAPDEELALIVRKKEKADGAWAEDALIKALSKTR